MKSNYKKLAPYIRLVDIRNTSDERYDLLGVSVDKHFIKSIANTIGTDWRTYKVIQKGQFCYIPDTSRRGDKMGIALLTDYDIALVSQAYTVFEIINQEQLLPEYLNLWFKRPEFDRYARFHSHGSVREIFDWEEMCNVELPIPEIEEQRKIVEAYKTIEKRIALKRKINDNLESQARAIFHRYFIQDNDEKQYKAGTFNDLVLETVGGDWGDAETTDSTKRTRVRCIRGADIPAMNLGCFADAPIRYILHKNFEQKHLISNDIIIEISGGSPTQSTGRIAYISDEVLNRSAEPFICSNFCRVLRIKGDYFCYVVQYWQYLYRNGRMFTYENSSTGLKNFDLNGFLTEEEIPIPPIEIVARFQKEVMPIYREIRSNGIQIEHLERTMPNILPMMLANLSR